MQSRKPVTQNRVLQRLLQQQMHFKRLLQQQMHFNPCSAGVTGAVVAA
jgi:hypothetical protein